MHYLDTSVLTAYYCHEARSAHIQQLLSRIEGPVISPLVEVELFCVVSRKVRASEIDAAAARCIFSQHKLNIEEGRLVVALIQNVDFMRARTWIEELATALRVLDAIHLAAASRLGLILVTADAALAQAAKHFGVKHKLVA